MSIIQADCLEFLKGVPDKTYNLIYLDPPFNTGILQTKTTVKMNRSIEGREGFSGKTYSVQALATQQYNDYFSDYYGFLFPRLEELYRVLADDGSMFIHLDWRETHYVRVFLDSLFGRDNCLNEIIWHWDYGAKSKAYWPRKHNNVLYYVKDTENYTFDISQTDFLPYLAPKLVTKEKAERGKVPTDTWFLTIVPTNGHEKTGYPTQKPEALLRRILACHCKPGDKVLDPFAGSGTTGAVAQKLGLEFTMVDENPEAIRIMQERLYPPSYEELG